ncbi:RQC-minor-2 family DNA-binding protein [Pseudalkalibacillus hwajinpoensis]|uniref:RQC-minor-2 family DNA-binding protein n=1 Tax=Guptibacillus hwajinpoensis TaxID=208199 RepID=UPI001CFD70F9|nr:RQC-minor-2 family DNA-binding protein [Pseudalkalibacillus hwajinpoensis]
MTVEQHTYHFDAYPMFAFVPMGKKNKRIRSVGQKVQKGLLHRLHEHVKRKVDTLTKEERMKLQAFLEHDTEAVLPIPLNKEDELYPHFLRPEQLIWQSFSPMHGIPIRASATYSESYLTLSTDDLDHHLDLVFRDYLFCASLAQRERHEWENRIVKGFQRHPFIQLAKEKKEVVQAVEKMNHSPLISLLNSPEDLSFWRHRVEIVMRPYRAIPNAWLWGSGCTHEKEMVFHSSTWEIEYFCESCGFAVYYDITKDQVRLKEEVDLARAQKRIATIERQFNEMVEKTPRLVEKIDDVANAMLSFKPFDGLYNEVANLKSRLEAEEAPPSVTLYEQLRKVRLPEEREGSPLLWFSTVSTDTIEPFKPRTILPLLNEAELTRVRTYLDKLLSLSTRRPGDGDQYVTIKGNVLTYGEMKGVLQFISLNEHTPLHVITKVLTGQATNAIRTQGLHEDENFGLLNSWEEKHVVKAIKLMEKDGFLDKLLKGFMLTEKANSLVD